MYNWAHNKDSQRTIYEQLADYFRELVENGALVYGQKLLSQRDYCKIFKVSRPTINRAFELLKQEKIINIEPKKKAFISLMSKRTISVDWDNLAKTSYYIEQHPTNRRLINMRGADYTFNLYDYCFGESFFPNLPIKKALKLVMNNMPSYYNHIDFNVRGTLSLRKAICNHLAKSDIVATPSQVIVCNTFMSAFNLIFTAIGAKYLNCYLEDESYFSRVRQHTGFNYISLPMDKEGILPDVLENHLKTRQKGFLMLNTYCTMPGNITYTSERLNDILKISNKYKLPIIECAFDGDCWHDVPPALSLKSMDANQNVIYLFKLARPFMSVLTSAVVVPESLMPTLIDIKHQRDFFTEVIPQAILETLLTHNIYEDYMASIRPLITARRDATEILLHKHFSGLASWEKGSFSVFYRLNFEMDISPIFSSLEKEGIILFTPDIFASRKQFIWFCYTALELDELDYALGKIALCIKNLKK